MRHFFGGLMCTHPNPIYFHEVQEHGRAHLLAETPSRWCRYCGAIFIHKLCRDTCLSVRRYWVRVRS